MTIFEKYCKRKKCSRFFSYGRADRRQNYWLTPSLGVVAFDIERNIMILNNLIHENNNAIDVYMGQSRKAIIKDCMLDL